MYCYPSFLSVEEAISVKIKMDLTRIVVKLSSVDNANSRG